MHGFENKFEFVPLKFFGTSGYLQNFVKEKKSSMIHPNPYLFAHGQDFDEVEKM